MADIKLSVDEAFMNSLKKDTGVDKATDITSDALTLMRWAVNEVKQGRVLISTDAKGENARKIEMPVLEKAKSIK